MVLIMVLLNMARKVFFYSVFWLTSIVSITEGQQYNLTGSSEFAVLGEAFTWTCDMFLPPGDTVSFVKFYRNDILCVLIGSTSSGCVTQSALPKYNYTCVSDFVYSLTIPSGSMTEFEQGSIWRCEYHDKPLYKSPDITLRIAGQQYNLTGSLDYAQLGVTFTWTCRMVVPSGQTTNAINFYRDNVLCVAIGYINHDCINQSANPKYSYECLSEYVYSLTIPAESMTEDEQGSVWRCGSVANSSYRSSDVILKIANSPTVHTLSQQDIMEGRNLFVTCQATPGNPSPTTFYWTKVDDQGFQQNGPSLRLPYIQRTSSGTYRCTAENNYNNGEKGSDSQTMAVNVLYPPTLDTLSEQDIIEGRTLTITCQATPGNPNSTTFYWTKEDNPGFRQDGQTLQLLKIQRTSSGTYRCTAENNFNNEERGTHSQSMEVNVFYQPTIERRLLQIVNESEKITLTRDIVSNPLSNTSWYYGTQLLKTQTSVTTATYTIENTKCNDTKNYTLVASNGIGNTVTAMVELIVNCKPTTDITTITLAVTCTTGIEFSSMIIAYPKPSYELQYENRTRNDQMITTITKNGVNNFTVRIRQDVVEKRSFGFYFLRAINMFGETTISVNVIKQRRPNIPRNITVTCKVTEAIVQWISSFNGGDTQNFTVITLSGQDGTSLYNGLNDKGENEIHVTYVSNLEPSVTYWFFVSAKNSHGSSSSETISCTTVKETANSLTGVVAGSAGGTLALVTIIVILVIFVHRRYTCTFKLAFEKRNTDIKVDTNKEGSTYTTIKEQQEHTERNMYDELKPNENASQYKDILKKDNHGKNEKLYEKLPKNIDNNGEGKANKKMIPLKSKESSDDEFGSQNAEEYVNTSFMK